MFMGGKTKYYSEVSNTSQGICSLILYFRFTTQNADSS